MERVKTKVSIVVPVYNTAKYLKKCLQSLKYQSLRNIEIICVNDGSNDNSREIIEQFVAEDLRFKAIHKNNTGYGHSVNMGIRAAQSPYIGILESDDFAELNMFEKLYDAAEKNNVELVKANYNLYKEKPSVSSTFEEMLYGFPYEQVFSFKDNLSIFGINHPSVWSALYKKTFLEDNDIYFLETPGASYQDISFSFKVCANAEKVYFIRDALLNYRVDNLDSSVHNPLKIFCVCDELHEIEMYNRGRGEAGKIAKYWGEKLDGIVGWVKFKKYIWNYTRLSVPYQYAFLMKVLGELRDIGIKTYQLGIWKDDEKEILDKIVRNPDEFFKITGKGYEDSRLSKLPLLNHSFSIKSFQEAVTKYQDIYIYGAGQIGQKIWNCLKSMNAVHKVRGFVVSEQEDNPNNIEDKKVFTMSEMKAQDNKSALVLVALHKRYQCEVALGLQDGGYSNIMLIDDQVKAWIYEH